MNKLLLVALIALTSTFFGQELYKEFTNPLLPSRTLQLQVSEGKYWLDVIDMKGGNTQGLVIKTYELKRFNEMLEKAKQKYIEWGAVADSNNVTEMSKEISCPQLCTFKGYFLYGSKWHFDNSVLVSYKMKIGDGRKTLYLFVDKMIASDNKFMDTPGGALLFDSVEEIEAFQKLLNEEALIAWWKAQKEKEEKTDDLFKD